MTTRKSRLEATTAPSLARGPRLDPIADARQKGIRLTVSLLSLAVLSVFLYVILRNW